MNTVVITQCSHESECSYIKKPTGMCIVIFKYSACKIPPDPEDLDRHLHFSLKRKVLVWALCIIDLVSARDFNLKVGIRALVDHQHQCLPVILTVVVKVKRQNFFQLRSHVLEYLKTIKVSYCKEQQPKVLEKEFS